MTILIFGLLYLFDNYVTTGLYFGKEAGGYEYAFAVSDRVFLPGLGLLLAFAAAFDWKTTKTRKR